MALNISLHLNKNNKCPLIKTKTKIEPNKTKSKDREIEVINKRRYPQQENEVLTVKTRVDRSIIAFLSIRVI